MRTYDFSRAAALADKASKLCAQHRRHVFDANGDSHARALRRIGHLMGPHWRAMREWHRGERMLSMYA